MAGRADEIYTGLSEPAQDAARQLFLRLVTLGEGARTPAGASTADELGRDRARPGGDGGGDRRLRRSRLLSFDRDPRTGTPTIEVAHEALLREWARLRRWIDAARDDVRMHRRLVHSGPSGPTQTAITSFLLRGGHLAQFESWSEGSGLR